MSYKNIVLFLILASLQLFPMLSAAESRTVHIEAGADNTLYEDPQGSVSNGAGAILLVGRINSKVHSIRRAVFYFDVAGRLPDDAIVEAVSLKLSLEKGNGGARELRLHRLKMAWGEGAAAVNGGGQGAPAGPGDATWLHGFYPDAFWDSKGGQFIGRVSAMQAVGESGPYKWENTSHLVEDVQHWLRQPDKNYGWILIGDESVPQTVKRFSSREKVPPALRPVLAVTFSLSD